MEEKCDARVTYSQPVRDTLQHKYLSYSAITTDSALLCSPQKVFDGVEEYSKLDQNINLRLLTSSSSGTTESLRVSPLLSSPQVSQKSYKCVSVLLIFLYAVLARVRSLFSEL